jgi:hypothetical protein
MMTYHIRTRLTDLVGASLDEIHINAANPSQLVVLTADGAVLFTVDADHLYDHNGNRFNLVDVPTQFRPAEY